MRTIRHPHLLVSAAVAGVLTLGLTACVPEDEETTAAPVEAETTVEAEASEAPASAEPAPAEEPAPEEVSDDDVAPGFSDVTITGCPAFDDFGFAEIPLTITSTADARSSYSIDINVVSSEGVVVGSGIAFVENLDPGQTAETTAFADGPAGQHECVLVDVFRTGLF